MPKTDIEEPVDGALTVSKKQWEALLREVASLKRGAVVEKPKRVTDHTAILRFYKDQPIVGYANVEEVVIDGKRSAFIDLTLADGSKETVPYLQFLNDGNGEKVKIVSQKAEEHVKSYGTVKAINPDPKNQKTWDGGMIDLEVTSVTYQADVKVIEGPHEGQEYSVPTTCLNV